MWKWELCAYAQVHANYLILQNYVYIQKQMPHNISSSLSCKKRYIFKFKYSIAFPLDESIELIFPCPFHFLSLFLFTTLLLLFRCLVFPRVCHSDRTCCKYPPRSDQVWLTSWWAPSRNWLLWQRLHPHLHLPRFQWPPWHWSIASSPNKNLR